MELIASYEMEVEANEVEATRTIVSLSRELAIQIKAEKRVQSIPRNREFHLNE